MFMEITTLLAIIGAIFVAREKALAANILWSISNPMLAIYNLQSNQSWQALMFVVFSFIAISGVYCHMKRKGGK